VPGDDDSIGSHLATRATEVIESVVSALRDKAIRPVLAGARLAVIALVALSLFGVIAVVVVLGVLRLFTEDVFGGRAWATDFMFGGIFLASGVFLLKLGMRSRGGAGDD